MRTDSTPSHETERAAFEAIFSAPPYEFLMDRHPANPALAWPGRYKDYNVRCAWDAWQEARRAPAPTVEEYEQALSLLAGLHPGITIDGPPLEVAARIFDAVAADRANFEQEIRRQARALETMRAYAWRST